MLSLVLSGQGSNSCKLTPPVSYSFICLFDVYFYTIYDTPFVYSSALTVFTVTSLWKYIVKHTLPVGNSYY